MIVAAAAPCRRPRPVQCLGQRLLFQVNLTVESSQRGVNGNAVGGVEEPAKLGGCSGRGNVGCNLGVVGGPSPHCWWIGMLASRPQPSGGPYTWTPSTRASQSQGPQGPGRAVLGESPCYCYCTGHGRRRHTPATRVGLFAGRAGQRWPAAAACWP